MTYRAFKDFTRATAYNKILRDKALNNAKNPKDDSNQRGLTSIVWKFFDKKAFVGVIINDQLCLKELDEELHEAMIGKLKKGKVYWPFSDNIWVADLAGMQLVSKFNKGFQFLFCFIDIFSKYARVIPLKDKKTITITNAS